MTLEEAKKQLDIVIDKGRLHLYKPTQIAEILYRNRIVGDLDIEKLETYRVASRQWRDEISLKFLGRTCNSSIKYQDDLFSKTAVPVEALILLNKENIEKEGIVEEYIYRQFSDRFKQLEKALKYCSEKTPTTFKLEELLALFTEQKGLKRSIDKIYEIIVYGLFRTLIEVINIKIELKIDENQIDILKEFEDFTKKVMSISLENKLVDLDAAIHRVGVTNAADRGLDMFTNFGPIVQVKHISLTKEDAESITASVQGDRIVIVCKEDESKIIENLINQLGWISRIQSIIVEQELISWYEKALRGVYAEKTGEKLLNYLKSEIETEFPKTEENGFVEFFGERNYKVEEIDEFWK